MHNGLLAKPSDVNDLSDKIGQLLLDKNSGNDWARTLMSTSKYATTGIS